MSEDPSVYLACPKCGVVLRREDAHVNGAVLCPDCLKKGRKEVLELAYTGDPPPDSAAS
jgi:hypothetical protein